MQPSTPGQFAGRMTRHRRTSCCETARTLTCLGPSLIGKVDDLCYDAVMLCIQDHISAPGFASGLHPTGRQSVGGQGQAYTLYHFQSCLVVTCICGLEDADLDLKIVPGVGLFVIIRSTVDVSFCYPPWSRCSRTPGIGGSRHETSLPHIQQPEACP